jgi:glycosyltransferase involved in cell wall biosynthesis
LKNRREESLYRWGLKKATVVISQTRTQRQLLLDHFGVPSKVFNILSPDPPNDAPVPGERRRILWVGRISPEKRPHLLLDVIRQLPGHAVDVVGDANADTAYARGFRQQAQNHPFLVLHGRISNETLARMYGEAFLLVGTSETEGFPITFIEAWSRGIPVVSTFDPDGVIRANGLGYVAEGADGIVSYVKRVVQSPDLWSEASKVARQYYLANHAPGVCLPRYERLFLEVAGTDMSRMVGAMSS